MSRSTEDIGVLLFAFTCGYITLPTSFFLDGEEGNTKVPAAVFLIDHPDGLALFDTGFSDRYIGMETGLGKIVDVPDGETIDQRLLDYGVDPAEIKWIINSHLHLDHAGGNALLPNATMIVQEKEWDYRNAGEDNAYNADDFDTGQPVKRINGEHDLFGDGNVIIFPTPGHTPGHQSAKVKTVGGEAILAADCCNMRQSLDEMHLPDHCFDMTQYRSSLELLAKERAKGTTIFFGHDPDFWASIPQAEKIDLNGLS